jgi:hypothetical protein
MHWRTMAFLIWASALTPLSRRLICDCINIASQHRYSSRAVILLVAITYLISYKRREIFPTYALPRDSGLRPFSPGPRVYPGGFPADISPFWSGVMEALGALARSGVALQSRITVQKKGN